MTQFSLNTALFVPATRPERFAKAAAAGADVVILDLEDAVAAEDKAMARQALVSQLDGVACCWRINAIDSIHHSADIERLKTGPAPDLIMLPKAEAGAQFDLFAQQCRADGIIALVETARGITDARVLAAHPKVVALAFGTLDFCLELDAEHINALLDPMRVELVLASKLAKIAAPIDGVTANLSDPDLATIEARHAKALGMGGKLAIHPNQVAAIQSAFRPCEADILWAERVMQIQSGVERLDGQMVDAPVKARAANILKRAKRL